MFGGILSNSFNWEQVKLQDICSSIVRGPFGSSLKKEFFVKNGYKVYEQKNAINQSADLGEYYIDTLSVSPIAQGKGIGSSLLLHLKELLKGETIGLLVSMGNPLAEKLYLRMGFVYADMKMLGGNPYKHLIYN